MRLLCFDREIENNIAKKTDTIGELQAIYNKWEILKIAKV